MFHESISVRKLPKTKTKVAPIPDDTIVLHRVLTSVGIREGEVKERWGKVGGRGGGRWRERWGKVGGRGGVRREGEVGEGGRERWGKVVGERGGRGEIEGSRG